MNDVDTVCIASSSYCYTYFDYVDEIYVNNVVHPSKNFTSVNATTGRYQRGIITTSFRLTCSPNWYGQDCGTFCVAPSNTKFACNDDDGTLVCLKGWSGRNCTKGMIFK